MTPRIFVSSTYYDLRHVRERIERFIVNYGFEPVLFESDRVTYEHGQPLDESAYHEVSLCHMMILIVGGRYGSLASSQAWEFEVRKYEEDTVSITRREYETALSKDIPVFVFIDKNVHSEYSTYKENEDQFRSGGYENFKFAHVDSVNVFRFIDLVRSKAVRNFEKVEEIESYLKQQFAGFFYLYLESLKSKSESNKVLDYVSELKNVTKKMDVMLDSVGKKLLTKSGEYDNVLSRQLSILINHFCDTFYNSVDFKSKPAIGVSSEELAAIAEILFDQAVVRPIPLAFTGTYDEYMETKMILEEQRLQEINRMIHAIRPDITATQINFHTLHANYKEDIMPFTTDSDRPKIIDGFVRQLGFMLSDDLPF